MREGKNMLDGRLTNGGEDGETIKLVLYALGRMKI